LFEGSFSRLGAARWRKLPLGDPFGIPSDSRGTIKTIAHIEATPATTNTNARRKSMAIKSIFERYDF
jgi:hypothetical protein